MLGAMSYVPKDHNCLCPYLHASDVDALIAFLRVTFDAKQLSRMEGPDGRIAHAEVKIGDSIVMMGMPPPDKGMPAQVHCYVEDVDATYKRALAAGGVSVREPQDMFYGDRIAGVADPWKNQWFIATHKRDVSEEEMERIVKSMKP
jgi:PhnB protein